MGGVNPAQLLINADFCEQDVLVQKRRQKEEIRIASQPCRKEEKRAEGNEHQQHNVMQDVLEFVTLLSKGAVKQVKDLESLWSKQRTVNPGKHINTSKRSEKSLVSDVGNSIKGRETELAVGVDECDTCLLEKSERATEQVD